MAWALPCLPLSKGPQCPGQSQGWRGSELLGFTYLSPATGRCAAAGYDHSGPSWLVRHPGSSVSNIWVRPCRPDARCRSQLLGANRKSMVVQEQVRRAHPHSQCNLPALLQILSASPTHPELTKTLPAFFPKVASASTEAGQAQAPGWRISRERHLGLVRLVE